MKLLRCVNEECATAGNHFEAEAAVCPDCKKPCLELEYVHYLANDDGGPIKCAYGNRRVACMPLRQRLPKHCTGERVAVSCPKCKESKLFKGHESAETDQHVPIVEAKVVGEHKVAVEGWDLKGLPPEKAPNS